MLRVIIRRRLLVVVVVIVRVRHLARIEGLPRIINAMAPGAGRRRPPRAMARGRAVKSKMDGGGRMKVLYRKRLGIRIL